jgi:hypothetical protein
MVTGKYWNNFELTQLFYIASTINPQVYIKKIKTTGYYMVETSNVNLEKFIIIVTS